MKQYLILHKVRGEPAFDIAHKLEFEEGDERQDEDWWIVTTSGHRAYPYWHVPISAIGFKEVPDYYWQYTMPAMPIDLPDHYPIHQPKSTIPIISNLLERLGMVKKLERRV